MTATSGVTSSSASSINSDRASLFLGTQQGLDDPGLGEVVRDTPGGIREYSMDKQSIEIEPSVSVVHNISSV